MVRSFAPVAVALALLTVGQLLFRNAPFFVYISSLVAVNVVLAVSLNIINGMTGQFSIGHAGFMAVGAYAAGVFSIAMKDNRIGGEAMEPVSDQLFFFLALLLGGGAAALCGFVVGLPSLRLKGDYLAIVTLGFGEIIRVAVQNTASLGGSLGLSGIPQRATFFSAWFWVFIVILFARRLAGSPQGRALWAIREDEVAAEAMGVDTTGYKVRAFVVSSFFAGVAGALFAHFVPVINPGSFTFEKSMEVVVMIVAGGLGSTSGAVLAAVVLTLLPEAMRTAFVQFGGGDAGLAQKVDQIRKPIYGVLLVILMLVRPRGMFGTHEVWDLFKRRRSPAP